MKFIARIPVTAALLALTLGTAGCNKLKARDQLTKGVQAFKSARYEEAVNHFQQSIALDPDYEDAKLYLATAYSYQVVPNLDTPENLATAQKALDGFNAVLAKDPNDVTALKQIASIDRNIKKFDEAKEYEKKVIAHCLRNETLRPTGTYSRIRGLDAGIQECHYDSCGGWDNGCR